MNETTFYNAAVLRHFSKPRHAGDLEDRFQTVLTADVSESDSGAHITLAAGVENDIVAAMAYRVRGCPHLIAALELVCTALEDRPAAGLEKLSTADITQELGVPVEKAGRILLLEDALAMIWAQYSGSGNRG